MIGGAEAGHAIWTTGDYALVVSLCSAGISFVSLGWNVWSKFIFPKPRLRVRCRFYVSLPESGVVASFEDGLIPGSLKGQRVEYPSGGVEITNVGATPVTITSIVAKHHRRKKGAPETRVSFYRTYPPDPDAKKQERWLNFGALGELVVGPGQTRSVFFPVTPSMFKRLQLENMAVEDGYGRAHYIPVRDMVRLRGLTEACVLDSEE